MISSLSCSNKLNIYNYWGHHILPPKLNIIPMFLYCEQTWKSLPHHLFVLLHGLLWPKVFPLHFNLGDNSFLQHCFSSIEYTQGFDQELTFWFDLHMKQKFSQPSSLAVYLGNYVLYIMSFMNILLTCISYQLIIWLGS